MLLCLRGGELEGEQRWSSGLGKEGREGNSLGRKSARRVRWSAWEGSRRVCASSGSWQATLFLHASPPPSHHITRSSASMSAAALIQEQELQLRAQSYYPENVAHNSKQVE